MSWTKTTRPSPDDHDTHVLATEVTGPTGSAGPGAHAATASPSKHIPDRHHRGPDVPFPGSTAAVEAVGVSRAYETPDGETVQALADIDLRVDRGTMTAIMGPSGSGKSTLLNVLAGLDKPDRGSVFIDGADITAMKDRRLSKLRRERVGFIFQSFNLLPQLTARQNIVLPLELARRKVDKQRLEQLAEILEIRDRLDHRPSELSGGQQQRAAVARALLANPAVVFADEPTGALDSRNGAELLRLLRATVDEQGHTIVMVTHDAEAASWADVRIDVVDGRLHRHDDPQGQR